ncbi:hypothetical protein [Cryptosporangium phraense]|uniref:Uncharacterized protein n=1 Tax=Cryptosporangium phraense TaxID=2593070 RepID=A0A545ASZ8_9ACTN|nr:hypothetical protein [Cryptosporangium phraense]TQS43725.1 hypothetical protein FL583_16940 [Cryptosporangium phraense]
MAIPARRIRDRESFNNVTSSPHETAAIYFFKQLDPIYDAVCAVAQDFINRPHLYTRIGSDECVEALARLRSQLGTDPRLPSRDQRAQAYAAVYGPPNGVAEFDKLREDLMAAATAYAERVFDTGVDMLRERVRTAHKPLKDFLTGATGDSTRWTSGQALDNLAERTCFSVLRVPGISSVFGIASAPQKDWPYSEDSDANKLLDEISRRLTPANVLDRQGASSRQRVAARGAEAIASVLDYSENGADRGDDNASLDILITQVYTWATAKKALAMGATSN